jgi:hypothetical protein
MLAIAGIAKRPTTKNQNFFALILLEISAQSKISLNVSPNRSGARTFPNWRQIRNSSEKSRSGWIRPDSTVPKQSDDIPRSK